VNRFRWSALLVSLVLALSWTSAAQATTTATGDEKVCSLEEGLTSFSEEVSTQTTGTHPTASASFSVKEGCRVGVILASFNQVGELIDSEPPLPESGEIPTSGPGDHAVTVDLPVCSPFVVLFIGAQPTPQGGMPLAGTVLSELHASVSAMRAGDEPAPEPDQEQVFLGGTSGETECPTSSSSPSSTEPRPSTPSTTPAPGQVASPITTQPAEGALPFTGSNAMPMLVAALVLLTGGATILLAARRRSHQGE
jgi:hypothetical protein